MADLTAQCLHCNKETTKKNLRPAPNGGAVCSDWFSCQQRRDNSIEGILGSGVPSYGHGYRPW